MYNGTYFMDVVNGPPVPGTIRFLTGPLAGKTYHITRASTSIGREPNNDIVVSDPSVSRHHLQIQWNNGVWNITKLAPQNTVTVNQRDVQQTTIQNRDTIGLGQGTTFLFEYEKERVPAPPPAQVQPQNVVPQNPFPQRAAPPPPPIPVQQPIVLGSPAQGAPQPYIPTVASQQPFQGRPESATQRAPLFTDNLPNSPSNITGIPTLEVSTNVDHERHIHSLAPQINVFDIGRDPSNGIVISRPTVSGFHAQIVREGNQLVFIHPHPTRGRTLNGISYQGQTFRGDEPFRKVLSRGDVFRISDQNGTFVTLTYNDGSGMAQEILPEIRPIPLGAPVITIGRHPDNMVVLNHPQVSGHHARLERMKNTYRIIDQGSTNHIYINAKRVANQQLQPGDEIRISPFKLTFTGTELTQQEESSIRIDALHIKKSGNKRVILLNDISIAIPPRKFVAVVGGSGAGKSTLLDALNGLRPAQEGTVLYNGQDYYRHLAAFSTQLGYVPQEDIIHRDLTVERALYYAAKLRLPNDFTKKQIKERINEVLEDVEMKHRRNLLVSKLSGGQRKRVSIALELLANPSIFFLDEPTSGLDPGLDRKMMLLLRKLADKGHTIILVTHATNNINACDYVCFLCQGGRLAYYGPPNEAKVYFGKTDFAEIYSALEPTEENPNIPAEAEARFKQSPDFGRYVVEALNQGPAGRAEVQNTVAAIKPPKRGNPWKQFILLSMRYLELLINDRVNLAILILQAPIIAIVLMFLTASATFTNSSVVTCPVHEDIANNSGRIVSDCQRLVNSLDTPQGKLSAAQQGKTKDQILQESIQFGSGGDAQKILFIMAFAAVMFGCINGAREIVKEAPIYKRERTVNLGIAPYMFSKIVVLGILCMIQSFILVLLVNYKSPFQHSIFLPPFVEIYITMALTALAGLMTGLTVSAIVPNNDRAMSLVPLTLIPQVIFAGVIFSLDDPAILQWPGAFFTARWSMAAMGSTVGLHGDKLAADKFSYHGTLFSTYSQTDALLHLLLCWFVLLLMIVVLGILIAWFLKRKDVRA